MSEPYVGRFGDAEGVPLPGLLATAPDGLPTIDNYDDVADLPTVYNELANGTQAALNGRLTQASPSSPAATTGFRRVTVSTAAPSGGADGDVWMQREA